MRIGIISDTHGYLDPLVLDYFADCDEIWHAGDFGSLEVADQLQACRPLRGVWGNIDDPAIRARFSETLRFTVEGLDVLMLHIAGQPPRYARGMRRRLQSPTPDLLVCGHTHVIRAVRDPAHGDLLYLNPGAAGNEGQHVMRTVILMELSSGEVSRLQVLELGPRGRRPASRR